MIDFELTAEEQKMVDDGHRDAVEMLRPISRYYDEPDRQAVGE